MGSGLTLRKLVRSVNVVTSNNDDWQLEAHIIGIDQHLCGSLGSSIRICRRQNGSLKQICTILRDFTINLIRRDVDKLGNLMSLGTLEQNMGTVDIGIGELIRVSEGQVDVGLSCEMENCIDLVLLDAANDVFRVGDVSVVELEVGEGVEHPCVVEGGTIVKFIKGDDVVGIWIGGGEVTDQPARAASSFVVSV